MYKPRPKAAKPKAMPTKEEFKRETRAVVLPRSITRREMRVFRASNNPEACGKEILKRHRANAKKVKLAKPRGELGKLAPKIRVPTDLSKKEEEQLIQAKKDPNRRLKGELRDMLKNRVPKIRTFVMKATIEEFNADGTFRDMNEMREEQRKKNLQRSKQNQAEKKRNIRLRKEQEKKRQNERSERIFTHYVKEVEPVKKKEPRKRNKPAAKILKQKKKAEALEIRKMNARRRKHKKEKKKNAPTFVTEADADTEYKSEGPLFDVYDVPYTTHFDENGDEIYDEQTDQQLPQQDIHEREGDRWWRKNAHTTKYFDSMIEGDITGIFKNLAKEIQVYLGKACDHAMVEKIDNFALLSAWVYSMYKARSRKEVAAITYVFVHTELVQSLCEFDNGSSKVVSMASAALISSFAKQAWDKILEKRNVPEFETQAFSDHVDSIANIFNVAVSSELLTVLRSFIASLMTMGVPELHENRDKIQFAIGDLPKLNFLSAIECLLDSIAKVSRIVEAVLRGENWRTALFSKEDFAMNVENLERLLSYADRLYEGAAVEGMMHFVEYSKQLRHYKEFFENRIQKINPYTARYKKVRSYLDTITAEQYRIQNKYADGSRITPLGVLVHGPPGIGKSSIVRLVNHIVAEVLGITDFDDGYVYARTATSDYWEMYDPLSQPIVRYTELADKKQALAEKTDDSVVRECLKLIDNQNFPVDMADLSKKGNVRARPMMVIADTNKPTLNAKYISDTPGAILRRWIFVTVRPKKEFRKPNGRLDGHASLASQARFFDKWDFTVQKHDGEFFKLLTGDKQYINVDEFVTVMRRIATEHFQKEEALKASFNNVNLASYGMFEEKNDFVSEAEHVEYNPLTLFAQRTSELTFDYFTMASLYFIFVALEIASKVTVAIHIKPKYMALAFLCVGILFMISPLASLFCMVTLVLILMATEKITSKFREKYDQRRRIAYDMLKAYVLGHDPIEITSTTVVTLCASIAAVLAMIKAYKWLKSSSDFLSESMADDTISEVEEKVEAASFIERIPVQDPDTKNWEFNERIICTPSVHTGTSTSLYTAVSRNLRRAIVTSEGHRARTCVLGICSNFALINTHALGPRDRSIQVEICGIGYPSESSFMTTQLDNDSIVDLGNDLTVIRCSSVLFKDVLKHVLKGAQPPNMSSGMISGVKCNVMYSETGTTLRDTKLGSIKLEKYLMYEYANHATGMCGMPLLLKIGKGWQIAGIHAAGDLHSRRCAATVLNQDRIRNAIRQISDKGMMELASQADTEVVLTTPGKKSPMRFERVKHVQYFGRSLRNVCVKQKSRLKKSPLDAKFRGALFEQFGFIPDTEYEPPIMGPKVINGKWISPYNEWLKKIKTAPRGLNRKVLRKISRLLTRRITRGLRKQGITQLKPIIMDAAINGIANDPFMRRINASTGGGYTFQGKKWTHMMLKDDKGNREALQELKDAVAKKLRILSEGRTYPMKVKATCKDEPRERSKARSGKTRIFFACDLDDLIIQRMFLSPFYTTMVSMNDLFYTCVGYDMHTAGNKFQKVFDTAEKLMEGDYKAYDLNMPPDIAHCAYTVIHNVLKEMGYNEEALRITRGILTALMYVLVIMLEEFFVRAGLQASGKYGTAEDNSLRGLILLMYFWYMHPKLKNLDFFECMRAFTYGDDVLAGIMKPVQDLFNSVTYAEFLKKEVGMEFTAADKGAALTPFVESDRASFLKRTFVYSERLGRTVCPLQKDSLVKAIQWILPSEVESEEDQMVATCVSVLRELFFHCDEGQYKYFRNFFIYELSQLYGFEEAFIAKKMPLFSELENKFSTLTHNVMAGSESEASQPQHVDITQTFVAESCVDQACCRRICQHFPQSKFKRTIAAPCLHGQDASKKNFTCALNEELVKYMEERRRELEVVLNYLEEAKDPTEGTPRDVVRRTNLYMTDERYRNDCDEYWALQQQRVAVERSVSMVRGLLERRSYFVTESEQLAPMLRGKVPSNVYMEDENVTNMGGEEADEKIAAYVDAPISGQTTELHIQNFLSRPVEILTASISPGTAAGAPFVVRPWMEFLNNVQIRRKLGSFGFLRGDLVITINVSGTHFHYGRLAVSYQPWPNYNETLQYVNSILGFQNTMKVAYYLQAPGATTINVNENKPTVLRVPWLHPQYTGRLFNDSPLIIPFGGNYTDFEDMGELYIATAVAVRSTSATVASDVSIFVYAHMENVQLGCPTATFVTESEVDDNEDERKVGPVEDVTSKAAEVLAGLSDIPVIGQYAHSGSMVATTMSRVASLFGFSYPVLNKAPERVKNEPYQNGAQLIGTDTGKKITLDPRQELTVDPRIYGTDQDEMSINYITSREGLLTIAEWAATDEPMTTVIFGTPVTPSMPLINYDGVNFDIMPTPLSMASLPFYYWRGDLEYRFEIVCSAFHRGKLAFYFDPNVSQAVLIETETNINRQYMKVVDIQQTQDVSFTVNWAYPRDWARVMPYSNLPTTWQYTSLGTPAAPGWFPFSNGSIYVKPFTKLQSPDGSSVEILVTVRSKNIKFNQFSSVNLPTQRVEGVALALDENGMELITEADSDDNAAHTTGDDVTNSFVLNPLEADDSMISQHHFGETPVSFRALLKRYVTTGNLSVVPGAVTTGSLTAIRPIIPDIVNNFSAGPEVWNLLSYLRLCYVCMRGSMKKRIFVNTDGNTRPLNVTKVTLRTPEVAASTFTSFTTLSTNDSVMSGTVAYQAYTNAGVEIEVPWYTNNLWGFSFNSGVVPTSTSYFEENYTRRYSFRTYLEGVTEDIRVGEDSAIGEDFSLGYFIGAAPFREVRI